MLIGCLGGTFDPVHRGHLHVARSVLQHTPIQEIRLVLSARPGHRQAPAASIEDRWNMLQLVCADPQLVADDIELQRTGLSYTVDTLLQYQRLEKDWIPCWILGWDAFALLHLWHRWQDVMSLCNLIVVERPGLDPASQPAAKELAPEIHTLFHQHETKVLSDDRTGRILRLVVPMLDISATQIRARISSQQPCEELLEDSVNAYIIKHGLYQD